MDLERLNAEFGLHDELRFDSGPGALPEAVVTNEHAMATISLQGGQVLSWRPREAQPVLWVSKCRYAAPSKAIRGGIPVCWPWFGPHPSDPAKSAHGIARTAAWRVVSTVSGDREREGATHVVLALDPSDALLAQFPHEFELQIDIGIGRALDVRLSTRNVGSEPFVITQALHSYFAVSDVRDITVEGLDRRFYIDQLDPRARRQQLGDVRISAETDRVYLDTADSCVIRDPGIERSIRISKSGSRSTVVWNPWIEKSKRMADFGDDEWPELLCIETANAADDRVEIAPGATHILSARIEIGRIDL
jgi:glucose-6-phosphate 1-epimerase